MVAIESTETLYLALGFVVPGLVIFYVRSMFITGRRPTHSENVLTYLVLSAVYYALTIHFIEKILAVEEPWTARAAIWVVLTIVGPALLGLLLGMSTQRQYAKRIADRLNLTLVHVIPAAWDWRFSSLPRGGLFVMVTLKGDQTVAGFFGRNSFASSDTGGTRHLHRGGVRRSGNWRVDASFSSSRHLHSCLRDTIYRVLGAQVGEYR